MKGFTLTTTQHIVLVTGASSGIGRAIAETMASKGDLVFAGARKQEDIDELNQIENIHGIELDVCKPEQIGEAIQHIESTAGRLDCLVNNAGLMGWGAVIDRDLAYFKSIFDVNMWGTIAMVKAAYPLLKKSPNNPAVFNISSQGANYTFPFWSPYHISKFAMEAFSGSLRREFMTVGIRVVSIAPGAFKSGMLSKQKEALDQYEKKYTSEFSAKVVKMLSLPVRGKDRKEQSPKVVGELIFKILRSKSTRARYQPGRRFVPDVFMEKLPTKLVDNIVRKIIA